jgi:uncharacterized protein YndB with AHSA1/START domain
MAAAAVSFENFSLTVTQEIHIRASIEKTFEALIEQLQENSTPEGKALPMKLEAWPGGRWYRDLGNGNGHLWAHVQAVKKPMLLEFYGPLFMSFGVSSNLQYRLSEADGGTLIKFHHKAFGMIPEDVRQGVGRGWTHINSRILARAEAKR